MMQKAGCALLSRPTGFMKADIRGPTNIRLGKSAPLNTSRFMEQECTKTPLKKGFRGIFKRHVVLIMKRHTESKYRVNYPRKGVMAGGMGSEAGGSSSVKLRRLSSG